MSKLKKEAVGQYNYVAPTPVPEKGGRKRNSKHSYPDFYPHHDVTVEIIDPKNFKLFNIQPPKMFDTSYFSDYRHPPAENFLPLSSKDDSKDPQYTAYIQAPQKSRSSEKQQDSKTARKSASEDFQQADKLTFSNAVKSAGNNVRLPNGSSQHPPGVARSQSAEPKQRPTKNDRVNEEFYRSLLKARSGSEWKRPPDVSYDVLNPDKPDPKRKTKPYGAPMEREQEKIASTLGEKKRPQRPSTVEEGAKPMRNGSLPSTPLPTSIVSPPVVERKDKFGKTVAKSISRTSTASGRSSTRNSQVFGRQEFQNRPMTSASSCISSVGEDYLLETGRHLNEALETIQEEEILDELHPPSPTDPKPRQILSEKRRRHKSKLKKPLPPADLFTKKGPDPRFYASKKNLRTPNEMERFRKARGRAYMRNVEQAIPELDYKDHEVKYQPERQLLTDARWKIRKDVKDVRDNNLHSLVDRFEKRHQIIKDETRTRLGDPTYIGRDPVSVYKLQEISNLAREKQPDLGFKVKYPLHNRRRVTPSLGSVQRARNLGSHAQIFNQPCAPPYWGPQKVDHALYLPPMAQGI